MRRSSLPVKLTMVGMMAVLVTACEREGITVHRVPKGIEKIAPEGPESESPDVSPANNVARPWTLPEGWVEVPADVPMRLATIEVPDQEVGTVQVAVTSFPGDVGGVLSNVNRWRSQMGQSAVSEAELEETISRFSRPGYRGYFTAIEAEESVLLAGGITGDLENCTWFVRATTTRSVANRLQPLLLEFLQSFGRRDGAP